MSERFFNTAGPSVAGDHYLIDPLERIEFAEIEALIAQKRYFVLHAPRQTGKTTSLLALMQRLNADGHYRALYVNIEAAQAARGVVEDGVATICSAFARSAALYLKDTKIGTWLNETGKGLPANDRITGLLAHWAEQAAGAGQPAILLLDEVDALVGDTLISLLRQIRAGYAQRPAAFPQSIVLCGVRDVRDYRIHTAHQEIVTGGSAFNIKSKSLRLGNFSREEAEELFRQHTADTGQAFEAAIFPELWEDTRGQPWLVNALGDELTWEDRAARDRSLPITLERYFAARERLIQSRATHLDQLTDKLREERVRRVIAPLLATEAVDARLPTDDLEYVADLGLVRTRPQLEISNRIYREVIPRELTWTTQVMVAQQQAWYLTAERRLDLPKLLAAFQQFFREHADAWIERFDYKEAGPQLLLQAFLQRIVNGGGRIQREYGLGRRRTDLFIEWPVDEAAGYHGPVQRIVLELKLLHTSPEHTLAIGLEQTADCAARAGADEAHLVIFDRRPGVSWDDKIWHQEHSAGGRAIGVWGA